MIWQTHLSGTLFQSKTQSYCTCPCHSYADTGTLKGIQWFWVIPDRKCRYREQMESADSIARMDSASRTNVSIAGMEEVLKYIYINNGTVCQLDYFCYIISLTYKVALFRILLCANLLYIRKCLELYFICSFRSKIQPAPAVIFI